LVSLNRDHRNVMVLATCQTLFGAGRSMIVLTAPLIAYGLMEEKTLATLPHALVIVGTALLTLPASLLMRRLGRRNGFAIGALIGSVGGLISILAIMIVDFWLFCLGTLLFGAAAGFAQHYRFAAADVAPLDFRSKAISLVLAGGVAAGILGPELSGVAKDWISSYEFLGVYIVLTLLTLSTAGVVMLVDIPGLTEAEAKVEPRPLKVIMRQPVFIVAVLAAAVSQAVMNLMMTATPIAMHEAHHTFDDTVWVIEWHSIGMFAPGFFTGSLVKWWGELPLIIGGLLLIAVSVWFAVAGTSVMMFWISMALLGLGWNFSFTAGSSLLIQAHTPGERAKTQGIVNFIIYGGAAIAALASGGLLHFFGWKWVNYVGLPLLAIAMIVTIWFALTQNKTAQSV
jgi:MFS family permease